MPPDLKLTNCADTSLLRCFVIMPFSATIHNKSGQPVTIKPEHWEHIFENWIKKAVESYSINGFHIQCERSMLRPGNFVKGIIHHLLESELVIADLTGCKPNVFYELGVRHALRSGTVIVTQEDIAQLPSDLSAYYCFRYDYSDEHHMYDRLFADFQMRLHEMIALTLINNYRHDNPIGDFLGATHHCLLEQLKEDRCNLSHLLELYCDLTAILREIEKLCRLILPDAVKYPFSSSAKDISRFEDDFYMISHRILKINKSNPAIPQYILTFIDELTTAIQALTFSYQAISDADSSSANQFLLNLRSMKMLGHSHVERLLSDTIAKLKESQQIR